MITIVILVAIIGAEASALGAMAFALTRRRIGPLKPGDIAELVTCGQWGTKVRVVSCISANGSRYDRMDRECPIHGGTDCLVTWGRR
jgi:hypothetical protein